MGELETGSAGGGPYVREPITVVCVDGRSTHTAHAYLARESARWRALVEIGRADVLTTYPEQLAAGETLKYCCLRTAGHGPPHDVIDPLTSVTSPRE